MLNPTPNPPRIAVHQRAPTQPYPYDRPLQGRRGTERGGLTMRAPGIGPDRRGGVEEGKGSVRGGWGNAGYRREQCLQL
jgi:hypothetical protein